MGQHSTYAVFVSAEGESPSVVVRIDWDDITERKPDTTTEDVIGLSLETRETESEFDDWGLIGWIGLCEKFP